MKGHSRVWGLTPPGQTEPGIPYHVPSRWIPVEGEVGRELTCGLGGPGTGPIWESGCLGCAVRCCVFSLFVPLLLLFPLFAVLLNCPYPYPPVSASFFSFSSARRRGEGWPRGAFVAGGSRNQDSRKTKLIFCIYTRC